MEKLDATTALSIAMAMKANPDMTSWLLQELDPSTLTSLLFDNPDVIIGLVSSLDGSVIADAVNAE